MKKNKPVYVLGIGLSHHGSACLLKDGRIAVVIEKERVTRIKHDGYNDTSAITYCLETEGITLADIDLVVQNTAIGMFEYGNDHYYGKRLFDGSVDIPVVTISHHLAHAYAAIGLSPFEETAVFVLDGNGNPYEECMDLQDAIIPETIPSTLGNVYLEKDSFYVYKDHRLQTIYKDFTPIGYPAHEDYVLHPSRKHSMGNMYHAVTSYCGLGDNPGKLMGLAPYGTTGAFSHEIFELKDGRSFNRYDWIRNFHRPARSYKDLKDNFKYYADLAHAMQKEIERGILYLLKERKALIDPGIVNLAYSGGVALNAVSNYRILKESGFDNLFVTPAAGDNGISVGCAFYGWLEVLKQQRLMHDGNTCFGKVYPKAAIRESLDTYINAGAGLIRKMVENLLGVVPNCLNRDKLTKDSFRIQFIVPDVGIYSFQLEFDQCRLLPGIVENPDCTVTADGMTLIKTQFDASSFITGMYSNAIRITGNERYFTEALDLHQLMEKGMAANRELNAECSVRYLEDGDYINTTARLLALGKVVGWFQGASEFGPRALGHRSILADPRRADIRDFINSRIKFREDFRPFAPSVLKEDVNTYFHMEAESPYMLMITQVKEEWRDKIPGIVHVDNSARIQTVTGEWNAPYYELLTAFKEVSGISILVNTSFNTAGMPIVETPAEAINMFYATALDVLVLDSFIICKDPADAALVSKWQHESKKVAGMLY